MKVFLTGGAGYIGSVTAGRLLDAGHEVLVFDNLGRGHREALDRRAGFVEGDLLDADRVSGAVRDFGPDAVMHFAAFALVVESMSDPALYFHNNVIGGMHLAAAMLKHGVGRIIFSSTCATYGEPDRVPITEDTPQSPTNPYGESKLVLEKILRWYHEREGMKTVFLRYFNAAGATERLGEDHDPETHLIPIVLQAALGKRERVHIYGDDYDTPDGTCIRDYIHIVDLAEAHALALATEHSGAFNLGNGNGYSVKEVVEAARQVTGCPIPAETAPRRPGDPPRLVASAEKARNVLGWRPRFPALRDIVATAWAWHRDRPDGYGS